MERLVLLFLISFAGVQAQTLGQFRIVDFAAKTASRISSVQGVEIDTAQPHGLNTGDAVYIYKPLTLAQDATVPGFGNHGNRGRGYFLVSVTSPTHFTLTSEMYTGASSGIGNGVAAGDLAVPLTTYRLRQGPKVWLDGPIPRGSWSASVSYRTHELVTNNGNSYMAIADNTNQQPPNPSCWVQVDPSLIGPGTFTASIRDTNGKAGSGNLAFTQMQSLLKKYWLQPAATYDYANQVFANGAFGTSAAFNWFATDDKTSYAAALRLATQTEDLASGTPACLTVGAAYCGNRLYDVDNGRAQAMVWTGGLGAIYDTLTADQKHALADRLLNDNDVTHNGIESNGGTNCVNDAYLSGPGQLSISKYVVTGSGFSSLSDLQPGGVILRNQNGTYTVIGRIKSVDSDTQMTLEQAAYSQASTSLSLTNWYYTHPFGYQGQHTCGVLWFLKHHGSSPRMIPGQEAHYGATDYTQIVNPDDSPRQNKSIVALAPYISMAMLLGNDDLRAVRLGEQAINYYMTQTMAQENKSRWTGLDGHGTQYGTDRTAIAATDIALVLKNSLSSTPPGVLSGTYLRSILAAYQYSAWLGRPLFVQPWATGYGAATGSYTSERLSDFGSPMLLAATLYPDDPLTPVTWDYLRRRRGDFGNLSLDGGWGSQFFLSYAFPFYDPLAKAAPPTNLPLQRALWGTDELECINAGLYCRPDTGESIAFSQTGWSGSDTQLMIQAQAALPTWDDDNYGTAGSYTILQNNGANSVYLLGGNGLAGSALLPSSGMEQGNTISIFDPATRKDLWATRGSSHQYARLKRWAGDPQSGVSDSSYAYAMVDLTPTVRDAAHGYDPGNAARSCFYQSPACSSKSGQSLINRQIIHFKKPASPTYIVDYDDIEIPSSKYELRAYFHYEISSGVAPGTDQRYPAWITTFDPAGKNVVLTVPNSARLSSRFLPVAPAGPPRTLSHASAAVPNSGVLRRTQIALTVDKPDGTYLPTTQLPAAAIPGTWRVTLCSSDDGTTCAPANAAEWIAVHKPSANVTDAMPSVDQDQCSGTGGNCTVVEIQDPVAPKVAGFARSGALLSAAVFNTTHQGQAQYVFVGLAPGVYSVSSGSVPVATGIVVAPDDTSLSFTSGAGLISILRVSPGVAAIHITPSTTLSVNGQQQSVRRVHVQRRSSWRRTKCSHQRLHQPAYMGQ